MDNHFGFKHMVVLLILVLCIVFFSSLLIGSTRLDIRNILVPGSVDSIIFLSIRLPRTAAAILAGIAFSLSGLLVQSASGNDLASPNIIGMNSGAGFAVLVFLSFFPHLFGLLPLVAFIGGIAAVSFVFLISSLVGRYDSSGSLILAGIAVNSVIGGINSFLQLLFSDRLQFALMWMNGSLSGKSWNTVFSLFPYAVVGLILSFVAIKYANIIVLGDETAKSLGLNVGCTRLLLSILASYLAAITVANVGIIGFIGLVVPHTIRILSGGDHRKLMPMSMLLGGFLLLLADTIGRSIVDFMEIPVGTVMTILGGIFFIYLIYRNGRNYREL